jgi:hypothetical protein
LGHAPIRWSDRSTGHSHPVKHSDIFFSKRSLAPVFIDDVGFVNQNYAKEIAMAHEMERLRIFRHLSSLYQDMADTGELTAEEIEENIESGDELANIIVSSLSMEIVGTEGDAIVVRIKPLEDTWEFVEAYEKEALVKDLNQ